MAGPWEQYALPQTEVGPWAKYDAQRPQVLPDKYQQAAIEDRTKLKAAGIDTDAGLARIGMQGATFNTADEILAGLRTPFEMISRRTFDPREGYKYAKAQEDLALSEGRKRAGWLGTAADITGGVLTGSNLMHGGMTAARYLPKNAKLLPRSLASAADAGVMGTVAGAAEGNSLDERATNALWGGAVGGGIGVAAPSVIKVGQAVLSPVTSNIRARVNPEGYARSQVARAMMESSQTPQQIANDVAMAAREGQGMYTVADSMGNSGQRMLSATTRAPGPGRTQVVEFLDARQAGQGRRISNALAEGFDSPQTAAQAEAQLTAARDAASDIAYKAARQGARPVDVSGVISNINDTLQPGVNSVVKPIAYGHHGNPIGVSNIANDSVEAALESVRNRLTDGKNILTDFTAIQRIRGDLSDAVELARRAGQGNRARLLGGVLREIDSAMENASAGYKAANAQHAAGSRAIESVDIGRTAAMRGRVENTVPAFRAMPSTRQAAFRAGYVDPLIEQAQGGAFGANKARPLTSDAFRTEAAAVAPMRTQAQMQRRLGRENTMFETRNQALGGSKTADNLADQEALGVDPSLISNVLTGNISGAVRGVLSAGHRALTGNTPAVREEVARILTMRGGNVTPQQMQGILEQAINRVRSIQAIAALVGRGASGGVAVAPSTQR